MFHNPYDLIYNGESASNHGVYVVRQPDIPAPEKRVEYKDIKGRNGSVSITDDTYQDIEIEIELNYMSPKNEWERVYREVKKWLRVGGTRELQFSDDRSFFRKVRGISIGTNTRTSFRIGTLKPVFRCDPFEYLCAGKEAITNYSTIFNPYYTAAPTYKITGEGVCAITVNGKIVKANVGQNLTIDTDLMIAYRTDTKVLNNTAISGKYQDLYFLEGENTVSVTPGFKLEIIPNWRTL